MVMKDLGRLLEGEKVKSSGLDKNLSRQGESRDAAFPEGKWGTRAPGASLLLGAESLSTQVAVRWLER